MENTEWGELLFKKAGKKPPRVHPISWAHPLGLGLEKMNDRRTESSSCVG